MTLAKIARLLAVVSTFAATTLGLGAESQPDVDALLQKFITARGGKAAIEKVSSRSMKGHFQSAMMPGGADWETIAKAPNKLLTIVDLAGLAKIEDGCDGTVAWSKNPFEGGVKVKASDELAKTKRDADFYRDLRMKTLHPDLRLVGTEKLGDEEICVLESNPSRTSKERFSFSKKSGLLVRQESELESSQGKLSATVVMGDYRDVDGLKYAHRLETKIAVGGQQLEFTMTVKEIKHGISAEDARFAKPAS